MKLQLKSEITIPASRERVFAAAVSNEGLVACFRGDPPFVPGIDEVVYESGNGPAKGALRRIRLSDGSSLRERVLEFEPQRRHSYDMAEMNAAQRLLCTNMVGDWEFHDAAPKGTRVIWSYEIHVRSPFLWPVAKVLGWSFRRAMTRCLKNLDSRLSAPLPR